MKGKLLAYRADIDGLRAIAVLLVLLYHFDLGVNGGFVGVDVFFVISGYLITAAIKTSVDAGRFSFSDFYARRLSRLQPALLMTLAATLGAGYLLMDPASFSDLAQSTVYATLGASNIHFWLDQDYFDAAAHTRPLLHTWSLAAEWQFYLIWPLIVYGAMRLSQRWLPWLLLGITLASLLACQWMLGQHASAAYFMMPFRMFELSLGALLVFAPARKPSALTASVITLAGIAAILGASWLIDSNTAFPGFRALLPCLGAAACIHSGHSAAGAILRLRPLVLIGLISYSVYLIHWPMMVMYAYYVMRPLSLGEQSGLFAASIAGGALLYAAVEQRFIARKPGTLFRRSFYIATSSSVIIACALYICVEGGLKQRIPQTYAALSENPENFHKQHYGGEGFRLIQALGTPGGTPVAIVTGDSFAHQFAFGIDAVLAPRGQSVKGVFKLGCIISRKYGRFLDGTRDAQCTETHATLMETLKGNNLPLILAQSWDGYRTGISDSQGRQVVPASDKEYKDIMLDVIKALREDIGPDRQLFIAGAPPYPKTKFAASSCLMRPGFIHQVCEEQLSYEQEASGPYWINSHLRNYAANTDNTEFFDPASSLCFDQACAVARDGRIFYSDAMHLSREGSLRAASALFRMLEEG